ncbi:MAG TPA: GGDEF domain-containing protein [Euzebyales bacterium]|nr:GGDEF domain-containing protein [Euzebyales bacterium]
MHGTVGEDVGAMPALTEVQQLWRQLRWLAPALLLGALVVARPLVPGLPAGWLLAIGVTLVLTPALVNLATLPDPDAAAVPVPSPRQVAALGVDALVVLTFVALFTLADPGSDAFALLLLPQLQMATTRRVPLMLLTAAAGCAAFVAIELQAARLHDIAVPWATVGGRITLLVLGAGILARVSRVLANHIRALRALHRSMAHRALHDPLTGLPNRALFFERLRIALARQQRTGIRFAIVFVDLDDLKAVNDTLGHPAGDELLRVTARRLRDELRMTDTPARLGGDEFAALLERPGDDENLEDLGHRLLERLGQPVGWTTLHLPVSVSIGVASSEHATSAEELVGRADAAMYRAKAGGKGRIEHFDAGDVREVGR